MTIRTRSGRVSKVPERLELFEEIEDDYKEDEYDSDVDLLETDDEDFLEEEDSDEDEEDYSDSDADENGNLKDFVVDDDDEDEDYLEDEEDEESEYSDE